MITLTIDGRTISAEENTTIMQAAAQNGIHIPSLCYLKDVNEIAACRVCVVEIEGTSRLVPSCNTKVSEGLVVKTNSPRARNARRMNVQLILSQHDCHCLTCVRNGNCQLQAIAADLNIREIPFDEKSYENRWNMDAPLIKLDSKCIKCMRCVQVCDKVQSMHIWDVKGTGGYTTIGPINGKAIDATACTFCGQCITHCPTGALSARDDIEKVFHEIDDPDTITVVQVAPAVRTAWGEYFGMKREDATIERMATALKMLGFDYVFDTNFAADLTIMEEGSEFLERFTHKDQYSWPMFTSCCPGWVRFVKGQFPEFTSNLSTAKSPQQMFGAVTKSYFAEKLGVDPHNIRVISVMPCSAKKSESALSSMNDACGDPDVDHVITTRELVRMLRSTHINPALLEETTLDSPLGTGTGAAVIFGTSGGVMDAALRSAYYMITGKNPDADSFVHVRGINGWKEAQFDIPGAGTIRVAVASGLGNARKLLEAVKAGTAKYDFVEIMACPGGCVGGGGQPIIEGVELAEARGCDLWRIDKNSKIRYSHENPDVQALYTEYFGTPLSKKSHQLLHADHFAWKMLE